MIHHKFTGIHNFFLRAKPFLPANLYGTGVKRNRG